MNGDVEVLTPLSYLCPASTLADDGSEEVCEHFLCQSCQAVGVGKTVVCECAHEIDDGGELKIGRARQIPTPPQPSPPPTATAPQDVLGLLAANQVALTTLLTKQAGGSGSVKSHMKTSINLNFPVGTRAHLADMELWLREFDRVVDHASNNSGLPAQDKIIHLFAVVG